jgi:hypothetical protein
MVHSTRSRRFTGLATASKSYDSIAWSAANAQAAAAEVGPFELRGLARAFCEKDNIDPRSTKLPAEKGNCNCPRKVRGRTCQLRFQSADASATPNSHLDHTG